MQEPVYNQSARTIKQIFANNVGVINLKTEEQQPDFVHVSLDVVGAYRYVAPDFLEDAYQRLYTESLIILGGNYSFDKMTFSKKMGAEMVERESRPIQVKERLYASNAYSIFPLIENEEGEGQQGTLLIFNESSPEEFSFNIEKLHQILRQTGNFAIICSSMPMSSWKLSEKNRQFWFELPETPSYNSENLRSYLLHKMNNPASNWGNWIKNQKWEADSKIAEELKVQELFHVLSSPDEIDMFLHYLGKDYQEEKPAQSQLETIISRIREGQKEQQLNLWFLSLNQRQQLIVLVMHLMEGMYVDQLFAVIKELIREKWKKYEQELGNLDYQDLEFAQDFIRLEQATLELQILRTRFPNQRLDFIRIVWNHYRRHIILTVELMIQLASESVSNQAYNWELFGSPDRRKLLRIVVGELLSDLGLVSDKVIDMYLLTLAAHNHAGVHTVAAKALSRWRRFNEDERFFRFLEHWESSKEARETIKFIREKQGNISEKEETSSPITYIQATIAITLGYASMHDVPNALPEKILDFLSKLIRDRKKIVRRSLRYFTLPLIIRYHPEQLFKNQTLAKCFHSLELIPAIAEGLSMAYVEYPELVKEILNQWLAEGVSEKTMNIKPNRFTIRDTKIITVIQSYRQLPYDTQKHEVISRIDAFRIFGDLRKSENHPKIREILIDATLDLIEFDIGQTQLDPEKLLINIDPQERDYIVEELGRRFRSKRYDQNGGDYEIKIDGRWLHLWVDNERPRLEIEELIKRWRINEAKGVAQIATLVDASFFVPIRKWEKEAADKIIKEREEIAEKEKDQLRLPERTGDLPKVDPTLSTQFYLGTAGIIANLSRKEKKYLKNVLPVIIQGKSVIKKDVKVMVEEWKVDYGKEDTDISFAKIGKAVNIIFTMRGMLGAGDK